MAKRVLQLERENARLKKRQRKHHQRGVHTNEDLVVRSLAQNTEQGAACCARSGPSLPQLYSNTVMPFTFNHSPIVIQQFPFIRDYDLCGQPFVGADVEYVPTCPSATCSLSCAHPCT
jgi:hypothetical protein